METKICTKCNINKPIQKFPSAGILKGIKYYKSYCSSCRNNMIKSKRILKRVTIKCNICKNFKPINNFEKLKVKKDNRVHSRTCNICKDLINKKKEYFINNPNAGLRNRMNLSDTYLKELLVENTELKFKDITPELIAIKRKQLTLKRQLKHDTQNK